MKHIDIKQFKHKKGYQYLKILYENFNHFFKYIELDFIVSSRYYLNSKLFNALLKQQNIAMTDKKTINEIKNRINFLEKSSNPNTKKELLFLYNYLKTTTHYSHIRFFKNNNYKCKVAIKKSIKEFLQEYNLKHNKSYTINDLCVIKTHSIKWRHYDKSGL
jgi:hypothetical protein